MDTSCTSLSPKALSINEVEDLCRNSSINSVTGPVECAEALFSYSSSSSLAIKLCQEAQNAYPAICYISIRKTTTLSLENAVSLCFKAQDEKPSQCALVLSKQFKLKRLLSSIDIVKFCSQFSGEINITVNCLLNLNNQFLKEQKLILCKDARTSFSLECANRLSSFPINRLVIVKICHQALSPYSADCATSLIQSRNWKENEIIALCSKITSSLSLECLKLAKTRQFTNEQMIELCSGAESILAANCAISPKIPSIYSLTERTDLCKNANTLIPLKCIQEFTDVSVPSNIKLLFCNSITSLTALRCFRKADKALSNELKAKSCMKAINNAPNECFSKSASTSNLMSENRVELCKERSSIFPALCYNNLPKEISLLNGINFCNQVTSEASSLCVKACPNSLTLEQKLKLCLNSSSNAPVLCYSNIKTFSSSIEDKVNLCSKALSTFPSECAQNLSVFLIPKAVVLLCKNAISHFPAACANAMPLGVPSIYIIRACHQANSLIPSYCFKYLQNGRSYDALLLQECIQAKSIPKSLSIRSIQYDCKPLLPRCKFTIFLQFHDQFTQAVTSFSNRSIHLSIKNEEGNLIFRKTSLDFREGNYIFSNLSIEKPGLYLLSFESQHVSSIETRIEIHVNTTELRLLNLCFKMYKEFKCSLIKEKISTFSFLDKKWFIPSVITCRNKMEEIGILFNSFLENKLIFKVHPIFYRFLMGLGFYEENLSHYDILEIQLNASLSNIRKAYYKKSLEWHPDRWINFPSSFRLRSQRIFNRITEAYRELIYNYKEDKKKKRKKENEKV